MQTGEDLDSPALSDKSPKSQKSEKSQKSKSEKEDPEMKDMTEEQEDDAAADKKDGADAKADNEVTDEQILAATIPMKKY